MEKRNLLLNPRDLGPIQEDPKTQELLQLTARFFEEKGTYTLKMDENKRRMPTDFYQFIKQSGVFASMLIPKGYGSDPEARWDQYRITVLSELLGFYGMYQYAFQVSILGVGPVWMGENEYQKQRLAQLLEEGHVFAFGMSERDHGADLYSNEAAIKRVGEGSYVANGSKYYIGNSSRAPLISVFGKDADTGEFVFWVVDSRDRHCKYCKDIEVAGMFTGQLGEFEIIEYPIQEQDILMRGGEAFALGLSTVNIGKTQTSMNNVGIATHGFYEAISHSHNRYLYGKRVTDMPHIRRAFVESWSRILMARLYGYRTTDYFRYANPESDRRYLLFNPIQKSRGNMECERAVTLYHNVVAAKGYETDTFIYSAVNTVGMPTKLEGTAHVNMLQASKFVENYFNNPVDIPEIGDGRVVKDDTDSVLNQAFGKVKNVRFPNYRRSYGDCGLANVKVLLEQADAFKRFNDHSPMSKEQAANPDFLLSVAEIFSTIVYAQLVYEKARLEGIEDSVIDQLFSYLVRDINLSAIRQLGEYAGHFLPGQKENLQAMIKDPVIDFQREEAIFADYILALDGLYKSAPGVLDTE